MLSCLHYFLLIFPSYFALLLNSPPEYQPGYGYVGPACAVFDSTLFLHGVSKRKLNDHELHIFQSYQHDLSAFKDSSSSFDSFEASFPTIPKFCGGYDDSIEVILDSCIVRNNHVYVGDNLIRPLTNFEKQKIQLVKMRRMYGELKKKRSRRSSKSLPETLPQRDFSEMLHKLLNINSTVTSRFLPVVSQSPLFAMEGRWENLLEIGKDKDMIELLAATQFKPQPPPPPSLPVSPIVDITRIDSPYRAKFTTMKPKKSQKAEKKKDVFTTKTAVKTTTTTEATTTSTKTIAPTTTTTPRYISLQTLPPSTTTRRPNIERSKKMPESARPSSSLSSVQTVVDPIILKLISKALERNEMIDEYALKQALYMRNVETTTTALPLRFIIPTAPPSNPFQTSSRIGGLSHNHLFIPNQPFTTLVSSDSRYSAPNPLSHRLPNEICRVHMNSNPFYFNV
ncbi:Protein CBG13131 [Caenorhabditis briggsae]|uniref:Protein CBG13131 n=1 Tax=Caenorhabditis briggsae TaxID=6238 RepID=A8XH49_CAEBR|nr:Protein CBG13131 [Caenorhabditis briggsae]CAP31973.2 Protein CBG13131 [Caenorhabditis briggsae]